jgi:inosose dehydratase
MAPREALELIARIGYDGVELCIMPDWPTDSATLTKDSQRLIRDTLRDRNLTPFAFIDGLTMSPDPQRKVRNLERVKLAASLAETLNATPVLDTVLGYKPRDWEAVKASMAQEVAAWAQAARNSSVTIGIKPHAGQALDHPDKALWLLRQVSSPNVRVVYDYSHMQLEGLSIENSLRPLLPHTGMISVKDAKGTAERPQYLLPGDGTVDYLAYFRLLKRLHYRGFVGVEVSRMIFDRPGYDPVRTARLCYERLRPIFGSVGL